MAKAWMAAVLAGGLVVAAPATAQSYNDLYVFGDSLVDSGNARAARLASGGVDPAPPSLGYYEGRFSNGFNFADFLAMSITGRPATAAAFGGTNFSVGGAQAAEVLGDASPSFAEQIGFFDISGRAFNSNSLVLVTLGGNDIRSELAKLRTPGYTPTLAPALDAFRTGLGSLLDRGARNIVVTGLPDVGQIPAVTTLGIPQLSGAGTQLSFGLNQAFGQTVSGLATQTGANLQFFDLFAYQASIYADPAAFDLPGTLDMRNACLDVPGAAASGCQGYVYFDPVHPTSPVHSAIANGLIGQLGIGAVPEPSTWFMMMLGLGMAGAGLRQRRREPARVPA